MTDYQREYEMLKAEMEDRKWREQQRQDEEYRKRESQRREYQQEEREAQCWADSWEEAFAKGIRRYRQEAREEAAMVTQIRKDYEGREDQMEAWERDIVNEDSYFAAITERAEFAREALREAEHEMIPVIAMLEQQIKWAFEAARIKAAEKVEEKFGECDMSENLRTDSYINLVNW